MKKIKAALAALAAKLGTNRAKLKFTYSRWQYHNRKVTNKERRRNQFQKKADWARGHEHPRRAKKMDRIANRCERKRLRHRARRAELVTEIKRLKRAINHLEQNQKAREAQLVKWVKAHSLQIKGDRITGGTARERLVAGALAAAANCASGRRRNFYSQAGAYTTQHGITGEPSGYRSDCSQFVTSIYWSAGLEDPNGYNWTGGYTGTLVSHGRQVSSPKPGDLVLYGSGSAHHVEMFIGGGETVGHGSSPVDKGVVNLFGDGQYRFFSYV